MADSARLPSQTVAADLRLPNMSNVVPSRLLKKKQPEGKMQNAEGRTQNARIRASFCLLPFAFRLRFSATC
jgi:hypothetical protein